MAARWVWASLASSVFLLVMLNMYMYHYTVSWSISASPPANDADYVILPRNLCRKPEVDLVLAVPVSRKNRARRQVVRATWGSYSGSGIEGRRVEIGVNADTNSKENEYTVKTNVFDKKYNVVLVFFIGSSPTPLTSSKEQRDIQEEASQYWDIVQENFIDTYENLTLKSISIMRWVSKHCSHAKYVAKIDDDMFVNVPLLLHALHHWTTISLRNTPQPPGGRKQIQPGFQTGSNDQFQTPTLSLNATTRTFPSQRSSYIPPYIIGDVQVNARPIRDKWSKWYTPNSAFSGEFYPNYASGTAYAMSGTAAKKLYQASLRIPLFWMEDIYITGMCSREAKVPVLTDNRFTYTKRKVSGCVFRRKISGHRYSRGEIRKLHNELTNPQLECSGSI